MAVFGVNLLMVFSLPGEGECSPSDGGWRVPGGGVWHVPGSGV